MPLRDVRWFPTKENYRLFSILYRLTFRRCDVARPAVSTLPPVFLRSTAIGAREPLRRPMSMPIVSAWRATTETISTFDPSDPEPAERASVRGRCPSSGRSRSPSAGPAAIRVGSAEIRGRQVAGKEEKEAAGSTPGDEARSWRRHFRETAAAGGAIQPDGFDRVASSSRRAS